MINFFTLSHQKGGCFPSLVITLSSKRNQKGHQNRMEQEGEKVEYLASGTKASVLLDPLNNILGGFAPFWSDSVRK